MASPQGVRCIDCKQLPGELGLSRRGLCSACAFGRLSLSHRWAHLQTLMSAAELRKEVDRLGRMYDPNIIRTPPPGRPRKAV